MNKDLSDYNYLKNQQDPMKKFDKYKRKLSTKPSETLKYYSYLTNVQPIFDELIYFNENMDKKEKELKDKEKEEKDKEVKKLKDLNDKELKELLGEDKIIIKDLKKEVKKEEQKKNLKYDLFGDNEILKQEDNNQLVPYEKPLTDIEPVIKKEKKKKAGRPKKEEGQINIMSKNEIINELFNIKDENNKTIYKKKDLKQFDKNQLLDIKEGKVKYQDGLILRYLNN